MALYNLRQNNIFINELDIPKDLELIYKVIHLINHSFHNCSRFSFYLNYV